LPSIIINPTTLYYCCIVNSRGCLYQPYQYLYTWYIHNVKRHHLYESMCNGFSKLSWLLLSICCNPYKWCCSSYLISIKHWWNGRCHSYLLMSLVPIEHSMQGFGCIVTLDLEVLLKIHKYMITIGSFPDCSCPYFKEMATKALSK
jgi:hypothetical protein